MECGSVQSQHIVPDKVMIESRGQLEIAKQPAPI